MSQSCSSVCAFASGWTGLEAGHRAPACHPYMEKGERPSHAVSNISSQSHCTAGKTRDAGRHTEMSFTVHQILRDGRPGDTHRGTLRVYAAEVPHLARTSPPASSSCPSTLGRGVVRSIGPGYATIVRQRRGARLSCSSAPTASFRFRVKLTQLPASLHLFPYTHLPADTPFHTCPFELFGKHFLLLLFTVRRDADGTLGMTDRPHARHRKEARASKEDALIECSELHSKLPLLSFVACILSSKPADCCGLMQRS